MTSTEQRARDLMRELEKGGIVTSAWGWRQIEAALAACAREARIEALEEAARLVERKILTRPANTEYVPSYGLAAESRALERAVGESSLDQKGGRQHD